MSPDGHIALFYDEPLWSRQVAELKNLGQKT